MPFDNFSSEIKSSYSSTTDTIFTGSDGAGYIWEQHYELFLMVSLGMIGAVVITIVVCIYDTRFENQAICGPCRRCWQNWRNRRNQRNRRQDEEQENLDDMEMDKLN
ncbi:uncharacterized protein LOC143452762 [Clavelina lepadiformis]|uniref:uncharacterized protein LOC143452762 n=1 Tax=Clavelina lepadiformis TaxID=159417 RepID=UPI0040415971